MAELKTKENDKNVNEFISSIDNLDRANDTIELIKIIRRIGGVEPKMWGDAIIGFGNYTYESPRTGRTGEWFQFGISPRKAALTAYAPVYLEKLTDIMSRLNLKHGKGCLYIKSLKDTNMEALEDLIKYSFDKTKEL